MRRSSSALLLAFALLLVTGGSAGAFTVAAAPATQRAGAPAIELPDIVKPHRDAMAAATPAPVTDAVGDPNAWGTVGPSNDPHGRILLVWLWLLPLSGGLCLAGYLLAVAPLKKRDRRA